MKSVCIIIDDSPPICYNNIVGFEITHEKYDINADIVIRLFTDSLLQKDDAPPSKIAVNVRKPSARGISLSDEPEDISLEAVASENGILYKKRKSTGIVLDNSKTIKDSNSLVFDNLTVVTDHFMWNDNDVTSSIEPAIDQLVQREKVALSGHLLHTITHPLIKFSEDKRSFYIEEVISGIERETRKPVENSFEEGS